MKDMLIGIAVAFALWNGIAWMADRVHIRECDSEMRTWFNGQEYTCMVIPDEGLPRNNEELMK